MPVRWLEAVNAASQLTDLNVPRRTAWNDCKAHEKHCLSWCLLFARSVRGTGAPTGTDKLVVEPRFLTTKYTKNHQGCTKIANRHTLSNRVIGLAIDVHRGVVPSLVETVCQEAMCMEVQDAGIQFQRQAMVPVHEVQILSWPRMSGIRLGFLMNVHAQGQQTA